MPFPVLNTLYETPKYNAVIASTVLRWAALMLAILSVKGNWELGFMNSGADAQAYT
jgi:hypothetical protein